MTIPISQPVREALLIGLIRCPHCQRSMDEQDYFGTDIDDIGEHDRFRCRFCYPPITNN